MVTELLPRTMPSPVEILDRAVALRTDADLLDGYARRLLTTARALTGTAAPESSRRALERQAAACRVAARRLRTAADALLAHRRATAGGRGSPRAGAGRYEPWAVPGEDRGARG
ncbi:hypothetical protein ACFYVM_06060 [Streptomyces sp. NPDC003280]|uniref:hypothetical protein n=1 Tax=Streptomyces sp. NPDC003280 TaxID=3364680 RepID=UPI00368E95E0